MTDELILSEQRLGLHWETLDPFLFCAHHDDAYPAGDERMGPRASLEGRDLGQDFEGKDGWRMYHGDVVPGFPQHPHRGFETVTLVRRGYCDHSDSLGATARFGEGDVQWVTAGKGIVHSEMFPLRNQDAGNPLELFQLWLNLPRAQKMADPHFTMLWRERLRKVARTDERGRGSEVTVIAGRFEDAVGPPPPPQSWAADPAHDVGIWLVRLDPKATLTLPPAKAGSNRQLFFFSGPRITVAGHVAQESRGFTVKAERELALEAGDGPCEALVLQGQPIREPVAHYGPFVMNDRAELQQAFFDYQRTRFGGWPFKSDDPVHPREQGRFARHADGRVEQAGA